MPTKAPLPAGPLQKITKSWEYQGGWVRAPMKEIVFNNRLSYQARILWLWLSSVPKDKANIRWAECEKLLCCGTKARRNCLGQLVDEGLITLKENGVVIMHDPYRAPKNESNDEIITRIDHHEEISIDSEELELVEEKPKKKNNEEKKTNNKTIEIIIKSWNVNKPESYSSIRTVSGKQLQAVKAHLKNLSISEDNVDFFIKSVCDGIRKDDFWLNKNTNKAFSGIFGYGSATDRKAKNVELLYCSGVSQEDCNDIQPYLNSEQEELVNEYRSISFELEKARLAKNQKDINKWSAYLERINQSLSEANIMIEV